MTTSEPLDLDAIQARAELAGTLYPSTDVAGMTYAVVDDDIQEVVHTGTFDDLIPTVCTDAIALVAEARRLQARVAELEAWKQAALCGEQDVLREERDGARQRAATAEAALSTTRDALKQAHGYIANLVGPGWRDDERRQLAVEVQRLINAALDTSRTAARPERAPAPGTGELGTWKPEVIRAVQALRELDWTGFDPTSLDDLADVAAAVVNESDATFDPILPPPTE